MTRIEINRRQFLQGCCATAAASAAGPMLMFSPTAHAGPAEDVLIHVFLRGGMDGLSLVVPIDGEDRNHYEQARPTIKIPVTGSSATLGLTDESGAATGFGLHPAAAGLHQIWNEGRLAIVQSCGMTEVTTRSHFDAQMFLDLGTPNSMGLNSGWLARAWSAHTTQAQVPLLAMMDRAPVNMYGHPQALSMSDPGEFGLTSGSWQWQEPYDGRPANLRGVREVLADFWQGEGSPIQPGRNAEEAMRVVARQSYTPMPGSWPQTDLARQMWTIAESLRMEIGMRYATVDASGWDTHQSQGSAGDGYHYFQGKVEELSQALTALYADLKERNLLYRVTVVVQSEFGRRVKENGSQGTDHGYGNPLLVFGGGVYGRRMYGEWKGLSQDVLDANFGDVPVTTDYRRVLTELLIRRMSNNQIGAIFPGYTGYSPMGIFHGLDMEPKLQALPAMATSPAPTLAPRSTTIDTQTSVDQVLSGQRSITGNALRQAARRLFGGG